MTVFSFLFIVTYYYKLLKLKIESSYFIQTIKLFFPTSLLGSVTCKNCAKKTQNCRVIQNHDKGLKEGLKKQCLLWKIIRLDQTEKIFPD